jgi:hypothetical protein
MRALQKMIEDQVNADYTLVARGIKTAGVKIEPADFAVPFQEWLILRTNHKVSKPRSHQDAFETLCLGVFVVYESPFF